MRGRRRRGVRRGSAGRGRPGTTWAPRPGACTVVLSPGDDDQTELQAAPIAAERGDTLCPAAGRYALTGQLRLASAGVTRRGQDDPILDFSEQDSGAHGSEISAGDVTLENLTLREPAGRRRSIVARDNEATGNVAGVEIEDSTDADVHGNRLHGNNGGILVFNLRGFCVKDGKRAKAHDKLLEGDNLEDFAAEGSSVADMPRVDNVSPCECQETGSGEHGQRRFPPSRAPC